MMTELSDRLHSWMATGRFVTVDGAEVWQRVEGQGPWLVCVHGFPTSSRDWMWLLPLLVGHYRILIFDLPGFGLSEKNPVRDHSLLRQCDVLEAVCARLEIEDCHLLAHDMGNSVVCELLYRREQGETALRPHSVTLLNGGIYMDLHRPLPTQKLLRLPVIGELLARNGKYPLFRNQYRRLYAEPDHFDEEHYEEQWTLMRYSGGGRTLAKVAGYMQEREAAGERWTGPVERLDLPLQLIWGMEDPVAVPAIAQRLAARNRSAEWVKLDGIGHYPQIEFPERVAASVVRFIETRD
jgi:pimeloyl-ACP methyl ester carboxylesterase